MTKSLPIGLLCFGLAYVAVGLLSAWALPEDGWLATTWAGFSLVSAAVACCAVVVGLTAGRLTPTSTVVCAFVVQLTVVAITIGLYVALSSRGRGAIVWPPLLGQALVRKWPALLADIVAGTVWPIIWLLVFRRVAPRLVPAPGS